MSFSLHSRLAQDTVHLGDLPLSQVLLINEDLPWIILVPRIENLTEIHHLPREQQIQLMDESCAIANMMEMLFQPKKMNIGALGNMVPQLHLHHIARFENDIAWPGPVWGNSSGIARTTEKQQKLVDSLVEGLSDITGFKENKSQ
ncbi:HIT family protein [Vibrio sp. SS-MA-C1-2]|uniref:HIT domain-containing protein n=1 Tax=Vibrio sp. SS-MA-C1-2 TaxID=2908646 RepID=UPI001F214522|nr:HIT family protein [Vibrio sp. SS-MA-C1-2]UJF18640.1 HIT family protein [Vibrio sp. SS-MA-C1-2]